MRREIAEKIVPALMQFSAPFNSLSEISDDLEGPEAAEMRRHLAAIMIEVDKILRPILQEYPELDPDKDRGSA